MSSREECGRVVGQDRGGFTLVELAVVLVIMGLVGYLTYGSIFAYIRQEKVDRGRSEIEKIVNQLEGWAATQKSLPPPVGTGTDLLSTSYAFATDPWGNQVRYWLASELTGNAAISGVTTTTLNVLEYSALSAAGTLNGGTLDRTISNVAFVVANRGPDGVQQIETVGSVTTVRILTKGYGDITPSGSTTSYRYDDQAAYVTLNQLKSLLQE